MKRYQQYLLVGIFAMFFNQLYAVGIKPIGEIAICDKNISIYGDYKKIVDNFTRKEVTNILDWFNTMSYSPIKLRKEDGKYIVYYYYYDGTTKDIFIKYSEVTGKGGKGAHICNLKLSTLACYTTGRKTIAFNAFNFYKINDFLNNKPSSIKDAKDLKMTLAHELFHGVQDTFINGRMVTSKGQKRPYLWLSESTSEAVGRAYVKDSISSTNHYDTFFNIPFNYNDGVLPYERYPFFLWLGGYLNSVNSVGYLKNFNKVDDDALKSLKKGLEASTSKTFNELFSLYVAEKLNHLDAYYSVKSKHEITGVTAEKIPVHEVKFKIILDDENPVEEKIKTSSEALTASPHKFNLIYSDLGKATPQDLLRLVTLEIKGKKNKNDLTLVHEDKVFSKDADNIEKHKVRILLKATEETPLGLARIVNVAKDLTKTEKRDFEIEISDEPYEVLAPECVPSGETLDMSLDSFRHLGSFTPAMFNSKKVYLKPSKGTFKEGTTLWTAPTGEGKMDVDLIFEDVILHDNKKNEKPKEMKIENFTTIYYGNNCGVKITLNSGGTYIYDGFKDVGMMRENNSILLTQKPNIYMYERGEGWCHVNLESFFNLVLNGMGGMFGHEKQRLSSHFQLAAIGLRKYDAKGAKELSAGAKEIASGEFVRTKDGEGISAGGNTYANPKAIEKKFDFYRLPKALNEMLGLKRLREVLKERKKRAKELKKVSDAIYIKIDKKACRKEKGQCKSAVFGEKNGEKMHILYNKQNKISKLSIGGDSMVFDYGGFRAENIPTYSKSCFDK